MVVAAVIVCGDGGGGDCGDCVVMVVTVGVVNVSGDDGGGDGCRRGWQARVTQVEAAFIHARRHAHARALTQPLSVAARRSFQECLGWIGDASSTPVHRHPERDDAVSAQVTETAW